MVLKIRMTNELYNHVLATAEHIKEDASCVVKAVCIGFLNSRPVAQYEWKTLNKRCARNAEQIRGWKSEPSAENATHGNQWSIRIGTGTARLSRKVLKWPQ